MVSQCNRLCFLQMCKARHISIDVFFHQIKQCGHQFLDQFVCCQNFIAGVEFHIKGYLVITAASCMELLAGITGAFDEDRFHEAVDIFIFLCNL